MSRTVLSLSLFAALTLAYQGTAVSQADGQRGLPKDAAAAVADAASDHRSQLAVIVSRAIVSLDATGSRTADAIADSNVTLVLGDMPEANEIAVICQSAEKDLNAFIQNVTQLRELTGTVQNPSCTGSGRATDPFQLTFKLHYEGGEDGRFSETPLLLDASFPDQNTTEQQPDNPKPIHLGTPHTETSHATITLPRTWSPSDLPQPIHADSPFASFDRTVTVADSKLVTDQKFVIKTETVDVINIASFEKWGEAAKLSESTQLNLTSTKFSTDAFNGTTEEAKTEQALILQANTSTRDKDFPSADAAISKAEAIDPGHQLLHAVKGELAEARGNYSLALKEFQEELKAFPDQPVMMEGIARVQSKMGNNEDAIATLQ